MKIYVKTLIKNVKIYGANREIFQSMLSSKVYIILSCRRFGRPCQNSIS